MIREKENKLRTHSTTSGGFSLDSHCTKKKHNSPRLTKHEAKLDSDMEVTIPAGF